MLRMRYVGVLVVALALVFVAVGVASAQGNVTWPVQSVIVYKFTNPNAFLPRGMGSFGYAENSDMDAGWTGRFMFSGLTAGAAYTVKWNDTALCNFTSTGRTNEGCEVSSLPSPSGIVPFIFKPPTATTAADAACLVPAGLKLVDAGGTTVLTGARDTNWYSWCNWYGYVWTPK